MMKELNKLDRRSFLKTSALAGGGLMLSFSWIAESKAAKTLQNVAAEWNELTGYIKITSDNIIKILCPNPEFGQNVMTSLPMMVAEELGVDWDKVVVEMGPHDNVKLGPQFTGGSNSVRMYWKPLREAGATAKQMLRQAAAETWSVPIEEITTKSGVLNHSSGKSATYGEMANKAATLTMPKDLLLKAPKDFNIVSTSKKNVEGKKIVTGKPLFGIDYQVDGMLIAMIQHPPAFGMKLQSFDAAQALKMPGIKDIFSFKLYDADFVQGGFDTRSFNEMIAVVGNSTWEVMNARKRIKAKWEPAGDVIEVMSGRGGNTEVTVRGRLESTRKSDGNDGRKSQSPCKRAKKRW